VPLTSLNVGTASSLNLNQTMFATNTGFVSGLSGGAGNNLTCTAGTTIHSDNQFYQAGNGTGSSIINLAGGTFTNAAGTAKPSTFSFPQDANVTDANIPGVSQFFGSVAPFGYSISSLNGSVSLTVPGTAADFAGSGLSLSAATTLT